MPLAKVTATWVSGLVGHISCEIIISALDDYLETHDDSDTWYSFHEFEEVED